MNIKNPTPLTLQEQNLLLFEAVSGSQAYGLAIPTSDVDLKGVFVLPEDQFFGLAPPNQVANESNDEVYYELGRFFELLLKNNPNLIELLAVPEDCVRVKHPLYDRIQPEFFLSKLCKDTFAGYAMAQVKKARGLNKKIVNPMDKQRKTILEFCYVLHHQGSVLMENWLSERGLVQEKVGLVKIPHARDLYGMYYDENQKWGFKGVLRKKVANDVLLSSIPKGLEPIGYLSFNKDGYQSYCKDYKHYWEWVEKRNDARYQTTMNHGKNYDSKNMMHTFRLLDMAAEIAELGKVVVRRPNREFLLKIRFGEFEYDDLVAQAEAKIEQIQDLYKKSTLPDQPDVEAGERMLVEIRREWYRLKREQK